MKINCDMGESFGRWSLGEDQRMMPCIHMANIACGMHAADPLVMQKTVQLASKHQVSIGAHPGYPDLAGFGRRFMAIEGKELIAILIYQIGALQGFCQSEGVTLDYIKPHGALYNAMMQDNALFETLLQAIKHYNPKLDLVVMAVPDYLDYQKMAKNYGISLIFEAFVDRAYTDNGRLAPRSLPSACHNKLAQIELQAEQLIHEKQVTTLSGKILPVYADTLCVHGDSELALPTAKFLYNQKL